MMLKYFLWEMVCVCVWKKFNLESLKLGFVFGWYKVLIGQGLFLKIQVQPPCSAAKTVVKVTSQ